MKTVWFYLIVFILVFSSCSNNKSTPEGLMPEDSLVLVIVDMHLADAILIEPSIQQKQFAIKKIEFYNTVLKKHSLSKKEFQTNMDFYSSNPENFDLIYEKVIEKLTILQGNLLDTNSIKETP